MVSMERSPAAQPTSDETNAERLAPKDVSRKLRRFMENLLFASAEPPEEKAVRRSRILLRRGQFANPDIAEAHGLAVVLLICRGALQRVPTLSATPSPPEIESRLTDPPPQSLQGTRPNCAANRQ